MRLNRLFTARDSVVDLIDYDYNVLTVLSRFSLPLGFGQKTIGELCEESGIHTNAFLLIINFLLGGEIDSNALPGVSPADVVYFLHNSHDYYLSYKLPHIRTNLISALDAGHDDINPIIIKFFDDYTTLVKNHFNYEENVVFPYVRSLSGGSTSDYRIDIFRRHHDDEIEEKLSELKNIILRYYSTSMPFRMYDALADIYNCEEDLKSHARIENDILVPLISRMENQD
ncbi:hemerythrin domain-containing protein [uncultured Duncaniella sp.]|uniref:hemerythrin domain-containing protein n=1 Tax=uncultured Duncaniella sp. TaxID=2768039 RepID=UPI0025FBF3FB|nr:hemerythrin domain-containing protein [uncultured Duncaniella sp.]